MKAVIGDEVALEEPLRLACETKEPFEARAPQSELGQLPQCCGSTAKLKCQMRSQRPVSSSSRACSSPRKSPRDTIPTTRP